MSAASLDIFRVLIISFIRTAFYRVLCTC